MSDWKPTFALRGRTGLDPSKLYPVPGGVAPPRPTHCRNGHRLGPNQVTVSSVVCQNVPGAHQTYFCREPGCGDIIYVPEETEGCGH